MKKFICLFSAVTLILLSCTTQQPPAVVDAAAEKAAVSALIDNLNSSMIAEETDVAMALISDDALLVGTDPSEFWTKAQVNEMWKTVFADTSFHMNFTVDKREIKVAADGKSAVIIEQYILPFVSPLLPVRTIYNAKKSDDGWMVDFVCYNFIAKNADISKLTAALKPTADN